MLLGVHVCRALQSLKTRMLTNVCLARQCLRHYDTRQRAVPSVPDNASDLMFCSADRSLTPDSPAQVVTRNFSCRSLS